MNRREFIGSSVAIGASRGCVIKTKELSKFERLCKENRCKILYVPHDVLSEIFGDWSHRESIALPEWKIPEGTIIESVFYDQQRRCFGLFLLHESFDPVPAGTITPPFIDGPWDSRYVVYSKIADKGFRDHNPKGEHM